MQSTFKIDKETTSVRQWLLFFMIALVISGITAVPVKWELSILTRFFSADSMIGGWLDIVYRGVHEMDQRHPFLFYGYDWLAFAHIVIAIVFIGPYKDPVKNKWVIEFGIYACLLIIPFALIAGYFRNMPFWWQLIDCSFGIIGLIPLSICYKKINRLEELTIKNIEL
ncbi:MAG TPA: hypothetical protein VF487_01605 [Chitinophagaceae bacterium]